MNAIYNTQQYERFDFSDESSGYVISITSFHINLKLQQNKTNLIQKSKSKTMFIHIIYKETNKETNKNESKPANFAMKSTSFSKLPLYYYP